MNSWKANRPPAWELQIISGGNFSVDSPDLPSIEDVHEWDGKDVWLLGTSEVRDVSVERNTLAQS